MIIRGAIGFLRPDDGWRLLLGQLGLRADRVPSSGTIAPEQFAAIIVDQKLTDAQAERLEHYLREGGAVLDTGSLYEKIAGSRLRSRQIRGFVPHGHCETFGDLWRIDVHDAARIPADGGIDEPVRLLTIGRGRLALLGLDVGRLALDDRRARRRFYAPEGEHPDEIVSKVSKGELRLLVERALRWLHLDRGLPYLHLWHVPGEQESTFAYRIDSDYGTPREVRMLHDVARAHQAPLTWFLHVGAHHGWLDEFARFNGDEIAIHGFRHRTFRTFEENRANIAEAKALLERAGFRPVGFAAPNGLSNDGLVSAVHDLSLAYGSEFAVDYDDTPSFVPSRSGLFSSLQVPVHPISIGSLIRAKSSPSAMKRYFRLMIERKLAIGDPVIFYHHPLHGHFDVMDDTLAALGSEGVHGMTMGNYAAWWRLRAATRVELSLRDDGRFSVSGGRAPDVALRIVHPDGRISFVPSEGEMRLSDLVWRVPRNAVPAPSALDLLRRPSLRTLRHSLEDLNARSRQ
jgi:peptidoglycan/xylan/chitin deacetylase (PgdA/CDA1 family)